METNPIDGMLKRSPIARFFRWLALPATMGKALCAFVTLITLIAVFYCEERWRGHRAWEKCRAEMSAKGRSLDFGAYIPAPVPDDQNLAATPFLAQLFDFVPGTQTYRDPTVQAKIEAWKNAPENLAKEWGFKMGRAGRWELGEKTDLVALLGADPKPGGKKKAEVQTASQAMTQEEAANTLLKLLAETADPALEELRAASQRPHCRYNVKYDAVPTVGILLPHLALIKRTVTTLSWRASAELALGRTNEAFADLTLGCRLSDSFKDEPFLISQLVRIACRAILTQPMWEGMVDHKWSDAQLRQLQALLEKDDWAHDTQRTLLGERAGFAVNTLEQVMANQGGYTLDDLLNENPKRKPLHLLMPKGWLYFEMANLARGYEGYLAPYDEWKAGRVDTHGFVEALDHQAQERPHNLVRMVLEHSLLAYYFLPALGRCQRKALLAQSRSDLAAGACALERYYLAQGTYPEGLEELAPKFTAKAPLDVMTGKPMLYRRTTPSTFMLYSVGINWVDDHGKVAKTKSGGPRVEQGDWVWQQSGR